MMKPSQKKELVECFEEAIAVFSSIRNEVSDDSYDQRSIVEEAMNGAKEIIIKINENRLDDARREWSRLSKFVTDSFPWWLNRFSEQWSKIEDDLNRIRFKPL